MPEQPVTKQVGNALRGGWMEGGSFLGSILSGTLLGYLGDRWLGTEPWLVVTGIVLGSYAAFAGVWASLKAQDRPREER